ncbi:MAG: ATP-binding cassette domain-containing protein [Eggerthellaceae bacterium]|jgi:putative ABC transport system permease protein
MIEVRDLRKSYTTGSFTQRALDGVSITFRENEFVSVLGPSGSGKTTLLNVLGGLDHPDSGDIIINGVSTKDYKSADWDTYRNHHIGFIFQSYNLIPHQTVLSNVELALTLAGVSREERRARARKALERVGLGDHVDKKPSQLSGGQAQRVAIARALVNEPDIVLADEPTGALDTETGIQVMDLLSEIAQDRLVVMVTHNPDLAYRYSSRIVKLADGRITDDSDPVDADERAALLEAAHPADAADAGESAGSGSLSTASAKRTANKGRKKHSSMSFFTALSLSFSNLMTKKGRTFLTAFAGSIGIIGIATILALSNGVNNYIKQVEEETLSSYPLTITKSSFDLSAMLGTAQSDASQNTGSQESSAGTNGTAAADETSDQGIRERTVVQDMFADIKNNDLKSFKKWLEGNGSYVNDYTNAITYDYGVTPIIYTDDAKNPKKLNPSSLDEYRNLDSLGSMASLASMSSFEEMIDNPSVLDSQFEVVKGKWPEKYDECVLVLNSKGEISDYTLYNIGVLDPDDFSKMYKKAMNGQKVNVPDTKTNFTYDDALNLSFKVVDASDTYRHNESQNTWTDMSDKKSYMKNVVKNGMTMKVVGVVKARDTATTTSLQEGIAYRHDLTEHLMSDAADSAIVKQQLAHPKTDVFTGKSFKSLKKNSGFDMKSLFTVDQDALSSALSSSMGSSASGSSGSGMDASSLKGLDTSSLSSAIDVNKIAKEMKDMPMPSIDTGDLKLTAKQQAKLTAASTRIMNGFMAYYVNQHQGEEITADTDYSKDFQKYLQQPDVQADLQNVYQTVGTAATEQLQPIMQDYLTNTLEPYLQKKMSKTFQDAATQMASQMADAMSQAMQSSIENQMGNLSSSLATALQKSIHINMDQDDLSQMLTSMMNGSQTTYANNLTKLGYAKADDPESISIYPKDFGNKELVLDAIDDYNNMQTANDNKDAVISYSDVMGTLMSSVTDIVNMVSLVLIAFVSISLVVSSIMIGIITYISVLERRKEIGILRAMGASKGNVSNIFNAETVIEGLIAGVIAIAVVLIVSIPVNSIVLNVYKVPDIMSLPWTSALILIGISVLLTFIAGLIPSVSAARKDPVEALRSE